MPSTRLRKPSPVTLANEKVPIVALCRYLGMDLPDYTSGNIKTYCPFGDVEHSDQGMEAAFRVYPEPNNAYCFACGLFFSPVSLAAKAWDMTRREAAVNLLDWIGFKPLSLAEEWENVVNPVPVIDKESLGLALRVYVERISPGWAAQEVEDGYPQRQLTRCLALLDRVTTEAEAQVWLARCREVMSDAIGVATDATQDQAGARVDHPS